MKQALCSTEFIAKGAITPFGACLWSYSQMSLFEMKKAQQAQLKHKRRYCKVEGCEKIVKSQGLCQRHGAKPKYCRVPLCTKQAQGNYDGMCKSHFRACAHGVAMAPSTVSTTESVYCTIIPQCIRYNPSPDTLMPFSQYLLEHSNREVGWHRHDERRTRGLPAVDCTSPLDDWERNLISTEILLLVGTPTYESGHQQLARAWAISDPNFPNGFALTLGLDTIPASVMVDFGLFNNHVTLDSSEDEEALAADIFGG